MLVREICFVELWFKKISPLSEGENSASFALTAIVECNACWLKQTVSSCRDLAFLNPPVKDSFLVIPLNYERTILPELQRRPEFVHLMSKSKVGGLFWCFGKWPHFSQVQK